jgi:hypothetical protein
VSRKALSLTQTSTDFYRALERTFEGFFLAPFVYVRRARQRQAALIASKHSGGAIAVNPSLHMTG